MTVLADFPTPPEGHPDKKIKRSLVTGGRLNHQIKIIMDINNYNSLIK